MSASAPAMSSAGGVTIRELQKRYGDTIALAGLDLDARPGEILGVAGPNGAGKSTMVKILAGEVAADAGEIVVDGEPWSPILGWQRVAVVHQEPQLFPNLTVAQNIVVGRERSRWLRHGVNAGERKLLADLAIDGFADQPLGSVTLAVQQRTEIARALAQDARVFLFDEPNSALTEEESDDLFRRMHALADAGRVVILVSHRLAELVAHCNRVAIILDGRSARVLEGSALTHEAIARELVVGQTARDADAVARL
ncbi:MAG: ATP-binding cassette domain-containing protein, partial [Candidatus Limnocylindrales bacterium]